MFGPPPQAARVTSRAKTNMMIPIPIPILIQMPIPMEPAMHGGLVRVVCVWNCFVFVSRIVSTAMFLA